VIAGVLAFVYFRVLAPERQVLQYTLGVPEKTTVQSFAVSPDGHYLAIAAGRLWVRALDSLPAQPPPGTDVAAYPFWSPDSRYIAFFAGGKLKKIPVNGGPAQTLCDASGGRGGTWNREGVILFGLGGANGLLRVSQAGGVAVPVTRPESGGSHRFPVFLP